MDPLTADHGALLDLAKGLVGELHHLDAHRDPGPVHYAIHDTFLLRASEFADNLDAALLLARNCRYAAAFIVLRTAMEHEALDRLLFLADRYRVLAPCTDEQFADLLRRYEERDPSMANLAEPPKNVRRNKKAHVELVWRGVYSPDLDEGDGDIGPLSFHHLLLGEYDPLHPGPQDLTAVRAEGLSLDDERQRRSRTQRDLYREHLSWSNTLENLVLNNLATEADLPRLRVHYRFLSFFVHAYGSPRTMANSHTRQGVRPQYDHYSAELVLLYTIVLAVLELGHLIRRFGLPPRLELKGAEDREERLDRAAESIDYLWFPGVGTPQEYDRVAEANARVWAPLAEGGRLAAVQPAELDDGDIRYYEDPLIRLVGMHQSTREALGHSYASQWHRGDADVRKQTVLRGRSTS